MGQLKAFIRRRVLNMPIQNFKIKQGFDQDPRTFYMTEMELDVYPLISRIEPTTKPIPYRCKLSPLPIIGKESDITFEEYEQLCKDYKEAKVIDSSGSQTS